MKTYILSIFMLFSHPAAAQKFSMEYKEIQNIIRQFKVSIIRKDSAAFHSLFHENPVVWTGVVKNRSQQKRLEKNPGNRKKLFQRYLTKIFFATSWKKAGKKKNLGTSGSSMMM